MIRRYKGFTLLELAFSTMIAVVISVVLFGFFRDSIRNVKTSEKQLDAIRLFQGVSTRLRADLRDLRPYPRGLPIDLIDAPDDYPKKNFKIYKKVHWIDRKINSKLHKEEEFKREYRHVKITPTGPLFEFMPPNFTDKFYWKARPFLQHSKDHLPLRHALAVNRKREHRHLNAVVDEIYLYSDGQKILYRYFHHELRQPQQPLNYLVRYLVGKRGKEEELDRFAGPGSDGSKITSFQVMPVFTYSSVIYNNDMLYGGKMQVHLFMSFSVEVSLEVTDQDGKPYGFNFVFQDPGLRNNHFGAGIFKDRLY